MPDRRTRTVAGHPHRRREDPELVTSRGVDLPALSWATLWKVLLVMGAAIGSIWGGGIWWAEHRQADVVRDTLLKRQAEEIRVLQDVVYQEHPAYWRNILESQKQR